MKRLFLAFALILFAAPSFAQSEVAALWNEATIYRDEWGVPHVFANNPRAMAFAFGYAQSEDHLEDMLFGYRVANGRASEIFGERFAESDAHALVMRHRDLAELAYPTLDQVTKDLCEGFALGVNSWIVDNPDRTPGWADGVQPVDVLAFFHHYLMSMAPVDLKNLYRPAPGTPLGNAWALAPRMTREGQAVLVMNPHTDYDGIFQWYEAHLVTHDMNAYGATLFGLPTLLMGHNDVMGWALAPNQPDIGDVFGVVESVKQRNNPASVMRTRQATQYKAGRYTNESDTKHMFVWTEAGLRQQPVQRNMTYIGPVLTYSNGVPLSLRVGGYRDFGGLRQLYDMALARNLDQFRTVWERQQLPVFHVVYADKAGNLYYSYNAKVGNKSGLREDRRNVTRLAKTAWESPVSTRDMRGWGQDILPGQLPWLINPESGYIQTSGTPPWLVTEGTGWTRESWADWLVRDPDSYRAKRLRQLFNGGARSFEDSQSILFDIVVPLAVEVVPYLQSAARANPQFVNNSHPDLGVALRMLNEWDYLAHPDSTAMTYFHVWWTLFQRNYEKEALASEALHAMLQDETPQMQMFLLQTAAHTCEIMRTSFQSIQIPWGEAHVIQRGTRELPMPGAYTGEPVFGTGDRHFENGRWIVKQGPGFAMAVQFGEMPNALSWVPFGASENPDSPHFADQLPLMADRRFKHVRFTRPQVERHAVSAIGKAIVFRPAQTNAAVLMRAAAPVELTMGLSATSSIAIPDNVAAFTPYLEPVVRPAHTPAEVTMELHVPAERCSANALGRLAVYGYSQQGGWQYVQEQELNPRTRTFYARAYERQVFAVLGPEEYLIDDVRLADADTFEPDMLRLTRVNPATTEILPQTSGAAPLSNAERERIAMARAETAPDTEGRPYDVPESNPLMPMVNGVPIPAVPPGWDLRLMDEMQRRQLARQRDSDVLPPSAPRNQTVIRPGSSKRDENNELNGYIIKADEPEPVPSAQSEALASPSGLSMLNSAEEGKAQPDEKEGVISAGAEPDVMSEDLEPLELARGPEDTVLRPDPDTTAESKDVVEEAKGDDGEILITNDLIERHQEAKVRDEMTNPFRESEGGVSFEAGLPALEQPQEDPIDALKLTLAPDPELATPMFVGNEIDFFLPIFGGRFALSMGDQVRAQVAVMPEPPEPYPDGLVNFSAIFNCLYRPLSAKGINALSITVPQETHAAESFGKLSLWAHTAETGWLEIPDASRDPEARSFSAIDLYVRTYVILGPRELLLEAPQMVP